MGCYWVAVFRKKAPAERNRKLIEYFAALVCAYYTKLLAIAPAHSP